jgi:hypothetical protein
MRYVIMLTALLLAPLGASAQGIPSGPPSRRPEPSDTIRVPPFRQPPPVAPVTAALRSLVLPGWGQSVLNRRTSGAVFIFWEGITLTMTVKSLHQLHYREDSSPDTVDEKRQEMQDWAVLLAFNHLVAAAEAFVSAQLWDFPANLEVQAVPGGGFGAAVRVWW